VYEIPSLICISLAFAIIACGNSLFGILTHNTSRLLGQISYSIYLLHGMLLFLTFRFVIGFPAASNFSPVLHWSIIASCGILLVIVSSFTYRYVELPFINAAPDAAARLQLYLKDKAVEPSRAA
jgi:peptidoglycan/LPS O-acetylase OafA/YrhL